MIKIWGRNTSSNVQKAMWAVGELGLAHERIDIGGAFGKNKEPTYLAMNPNGLVPTLEEEDGFLLWESNSIVRYLAAKHDKTGALEPKDAASSAALASQWMDWQLSVLGPAITPAFWGLIRTPPEKRDMAAIKTSQEKTTAAMKILDAQLGKTHVRRRTGIFLRRHSGRRHVLPLPPAGAGPAGDAESRPLVRRDLAQAQGVPGSASVQRLVRSRSSALQALSPRSSFGTSPVKPAASRMNTRLSAGMRSTRPRPTSRDQPQHIGAVGEQPVEPVGGDAHRHGVEAPPALVALEHIGRADIEAEPRRVDDRLGQRRDIAQAHVEALPGDRMNDVRGVADQRERSAMKTRAVNRPSGKARRGPTTSMSPRCRPKRFSSSA